MKSSAEHRQAAEELLERLYAAQKDQSYDLTKSDIIGMAEAHALLATAPGDVTGTTSVTTRDIETTTGQGGKGSGSGTHSYSTYEYSFGESRSQDFKQGFQAGLEAERAATISQLILVKHSAWGEGEDPLSAESEALVKNVLQKLIEGFTKKPLGEGVVGP